MLPCELDPLFGGRLKTLEHRDKAIKFLGEKISGCHHDPSITGRCCKKGYWERTKRLSNDPKELRSFLA
jgi:hypothetical protein